MFNDDSEFIASCPACGTVIDYCQGHGEIGDPAGFRLLAAHDDGNHEACHPASECISGPPAKAWPHIHTYKTERDCDGRISRSWVTPVEDDDDETLDEVFDRAIIWAMPTWGNQRIEVIILPVQDEDTGEDEGDKRAELSWQTEEGDASVTIDTCSNPECEGKASTYQDHAAEAAGY